MKSTIELAQVCSEGDVCDKLYPIDVLMDDSLTTGISLLAPRQGPEGRDAHLDPGTVRLFDDGGAAAVPEAGALGVGAAGAHHVLGHDPVQPVAVLVRQDLHLDRVCRYV